MSASKRSPFKARVAQLDTKTRIECAKTMIRDKIINHVLEVVAIQANNEYLVYSNRLTEQIPRSYAANAYNVLSQTSFLFAVLRTAALWDTADENTASILTIVEYVDDDDVINALAEEHRHAHASLGVGMLNKPHSDPAIQAALERSIQDSQNRFAEKQAWKARRRLRRAICISRKIAQSPALERLRNSRDKHIAHALIQTRRERRNPVAPMKYGDEVHLLRQSIWLAENFYCWVNGTSFDIQRDSRDIAKKRAQELWENVELHIPSR
ncbi:hypothetical protein [Hoeflea sp. AS16]|uniref:AbiU2 domain-containing protein n=1 Tax=Hoeflea sp. AS16 TaxID=3135779 RepID=UPI00317B08F7